MLEGSVRKMGNKIRISVQLINVANGYQLWSERYDREIEDVFAIQEEISLSIAKMSSICSELTSSDGNTAFNSA